MIGPNLLFCSGFLHLYPIFIPATKLIRGKITKPILVSATHRKIDDLSICPQILFYIYFACWLYLIPVFVRLTAMSFSILSGIIRDNTLDDKLIHIPYLDKQNHSFCKIILLDTSRLNKSNNI